MPTLLPRPFQLAGGHSVTPLRTIACVAAAVSVLGAAAVVYVGRALANGNWR